MVFINKQTCANSFHKKTCAINKTYTILSDFVLHQLLVFTDAFILYIADIKVWGSGHFCLNKTPQIIFTQRAALESFCRFFTHNWFMLIEIKYQKREFKGHNFCCSRDDNLQWGWGTALREHRLASNYIRHSGSLLIYIFCMYLISKM